MILKNKLLFIFCFIIACDNSEEADALLKTSNAYPSFFSQDAITVANTLNDLQNDYDKLANDLINIAYALNFSTEFNFVNFLNQFNQLKEQGDTAINSGLNTREDKLSLIRARNDLDELSIDIIKSLSIFENIFKRYNEILNKDIICDHSFYQSAYPLASRIATNDEMKSTDISSLDDITLTTLVKGLIDPEKFISEDVITFIVEYLRDLQTFESRRDLVMKQLNELPLKGFEYTPLSDRHMEMVPFNANLEKAFMNKCTAIQSDYLIASAHLKKQLLDTTNQEINSLIIEASQNIDNTNPLNYITATKYLVLAKGNEMFLKNQGIEDLRQLVNDAITLGREYYDILRPKNSPYFNKRGSQNEAQ